MPSGITTAQTMWRFEKAIWFQYTACAPAYDAIYLKPERRCDLRAIESGLSTGVARAVVI
jgi:hypothetical protein